MKSKRSLNTLVEQKHRKKLWKAIVECMLYAVRINPAPAIVAEMLCKAKIGAYSAVGVQDQVTIHLTNPRCPNHKTKSTSSIFLPTLPNFVFIGSVARRAKRGHSSRSARQPRDGNKGLVDENTRLRNSGLSDAAIARMSQNERYEALVRLENAPSPDATAGAAAGATGLALVGALVLGRRREGDGDTPVPSDAPPVKDVTHDTWAHPPEKTPDSPKLAAYELTGKNPAEIKVHLESLSTTQLNLLAREGKNINLADLTKSDIVITKTDVLNYRNKIIDPAMESQVRALNEKVNSLLGGKLLTDVSTASLIHDLTSDVSGATYNDAIARAQALRLSANGFTDIANSFPILNQVREGMIQGSESNTTSSTNRYIDTVMPTADQLRVAEKKFKDFQDGNLPRLDDNTARIIAKNLILDADFAKLAQPQKLKDSYERLAKANDGYKVLVDKITKGELNQAQAKLELAKLDAAHKKVLAEHESNWKSYESDVAKMIQDRGTDGNVGISQLAKVSTGLIVDGPIQQKNVTANFRVYHDSSGNPILVASGDAIRLERASQQKDFQNAIKEASARPDGIPPKIKIDPVSGVIQTGLDGNKLTMSIADTERRKAAYEAIKAGLGNDFRPDLNPNFAKLEAIGNFEQKLSAKGEPLFENNKPVYTTSVNGVHFDFIGDHSVPPERSMVVADGANWMKLSQAAKESGIESLGLTSVKRDDSSSHGAGYSFDVGSVTDANGKEIFIKYNDTDFKDGVVPQPKPPLDKFLEKITNESSNKFAYNPYYMVDGNGNKTPNFFTAVGTENWKLTNDWDSKDFGLRPDQRKEFSKLMREMASENVPPYVLSEDNIKQMWNHRHHLHVTEITK